jgi:hypothetical protein
MLYACYLSKSAHSHTRPSQQAVEICDLKTLHRPSWGRNEEGCGEYMGVSGTVKKHWEGVMSNSMSVYGVCHAACLVYMMIYTAVVYLGLFWCLIAALWLAEQHDRAYKHWKRNRLQASRKRNVCTTTNTSIYDSVSYSLTWLTTLLASLFLPLPNSLQPTNKSRSLPLRSPLREISLPLKERSHFQAGPPLGSSYSVRWWRIV